MCSTLEHSLIWCDVDELVILIHVRMQLSIHCASELRTDANFDVTH